MSFQIVAVYNSRKNIFELIWKKIPSLFSFVENKNPILNDLLFIWHLAYLFNEIIIALFNQCKVNTTATHPSKQKTCV